MNMREAIVATLEDSGPATFVEVMGAACEGADDFNVNLLPGVLWQLGKEGKVKVDRGVYSGVKGEENEKL